MRLTSNTAALVAVVGLARVYVCSAGETDETATVADQAALLASRYGASSTGIALNEEALSDSNNRAGGGVIPQSLYRAGFKWIHTGKILPPNEVAGLDFISEFGDREVLSKIRGGQISVPHGSTGLMAFCGEDISTFEASATYPIIKKHSLGFGGQGIKNLVLCAQSTDWLEGFNNMCPMHSNLGKPEQQKLACSYDAIAITSNACNVRDLDLDVKMYAKFNKPIWIKGITCRDDPGVFTDPKKVVEYIQAAKVYCDKEPLVGRCSFGSTNPEEDNKAGISATLVNSAGLTDFGAAAAGLPLDSTGKFPCGEEQNKVFVKKFKVVEKTFIVDGEPVTLSKTKKKRKPCEWLYKLSQENDELKQLKFNKYCDNENKAMNACRGTCASVCNFEDALT